MRLKTFAIAIALVVGSVFVAADRSETSGGLKIMPEISFEGLVALVKSPAFDRGAVLAVDPTKATLHSHLPRHEPILTLPMRAVKNGNPDYFADAQQQIGVWRLEARRVSFQSSVAGKAIRPLRTAGDAPYPRSSNDWRDVKWIVDMDRLDGEGGGGEIKSDLMQGADLRGSILSSRIDLGAGMIESTEPGEPWNGAEVRFLLLNGPTPKPFQQAATQRLLYSPDAAEAFSIVLTPSDGTPARAIDLQAIRQSIPITISNHSTMATLTNHEMPHQAVHFLAYYDLLHTPTTHAVIPTSLGPFPTRRTVASTPGFFCPGDPPMLTWSFDR